MSLRMRWQLMIALLPRLLFPVLLAAPLAVPLLGLVPVANATRFVVYYNSDATPLDALSGLPYTHVILSFVVPAPTADDPLALAVSPKLDPFWGVVPRLQSEGKKVLLSFGGGEVGSAGYAPLAGHEAALAERLAALVESRQLDGVDIDFEASDAFELERAAGVPDGRAFLIALTRELRARLPSPRYLLTHAPQPPYLDPQWHGGPYLDVLRDVGDSVDWIAVQYYDNPGFDDPMSGVAATTYAGLVQTRNGLQWPAQKLLVGKPIYADDARSGHLPPQQVIDDIVQPLRARWGEAFGGLMGWQFSNETEDHQAWNQAVGAALMAPLPQTQSRGTR